MSLDPETYADPVRSLNGYITGFRKGTCHYNCYVVIFKTKSERNSVQSRYVFGFVFRHIGNRYILRLTNRIEDTFFFLFSKEVHLTRGTCGETGYLYISDSLVLTME